MHQQPQLALASPNSPRYFEELQQVATSPMSQETAALARGHEVPKSLWLLIESLGTELL
jgi:hypothetical protein